MPEKPKTCVRWAILPQEPNVIYVRADDVVAWMVQGVERIETDNLSADDIIRWLRHRATALADFAAITALDVGEFDRTVG